MRFDGTTLAAYRAGATPAARAQAVRDSLGSGTLTVELRDGETLVYAGTFAGPMTAGGDGSLSADVLLSGAVTTGGTPNAATWTCRIRNADGRYVEGSFGPGGRFTFSGGALVVGQAVRLRTQIRPAGWLPFAVLAEIDASNVDPSTVAVTAPESAEPDVYLRFRSGQWWRHFFFALEGAAGKRPTFDVNGYGTHLSGGAFTSAWKPIWTADFQTWHQASARTQSPESIQWQFDEAFPLGTVYVMSAPMVQQLHAPIYADRLLTQYSSVAAPAASADEGGVYNVTNAEVNYLGRQCGGNPQFAIKLSWPGPTTDGHAKRKLVMFAGIHAAGEHKSWFGFVSAVEWMLENSSSGAVDFRANWDVWLYFNVTPNGIVSGDTRTNPSRTTDPNRAFVVSGSSSISEITVLRAAVESDTGGSADVLLSWHGADARSSRFNLFLRESDYNAGTRSEAYQALIDVGGVILDEAPSLILSSVTSGDGWWGETVLGAKISLPVEMQGRGDNSYEEAVFVGTGWARTIQALDAAGIFTD